MGVRCRETDNREIHPGCADQHDGEHRQISEIDRRVTQPLVLHLLAIVLLYAKFNAVPVRLKSLNLMIFARDSARHHAATALFSTIF